MSTQVLAQSATQLSVSTPAEINFEAIVRKNAMRSVKGVTRERLLLNNSKLFSTCCDEVRSLLNIEKERGKLARLPDEVAEKLQLTIDEFINTQVNRINPNNCISFKRYAFADYKNLRIVERLQATGEETLALKQQHLDVIMMLTAKNKRLTDLQAKKTPNYDAEKSVKEQIEKLEKIKLHIETCIASLEEKKEQKQS